MDVLACRVCGDGLIPGETSWTCSGCSAAFEAIRGIPDLRTIDDLFMSTADDRAYARGLDEDYDRLDFRGLLERYYDLSPSIPRERRRREIAHILSAPGRARQWIEALGLGRADSGPILDLGCGPGGFLATAAGLLRGRTLWGLDIAMRWLVLARKRLDEEGLAHVRLVCAGAEAMPFRDRSFAGVVAGDAIEHVADQSATLAEAHRVLQPGGRLVMATPNRYSLAPEPHVGVWGVGFLPRRLMGPYVRLASGLEFRAIRTLGYREWRDLLRSSPFQDAEVAAPPLPADNQAHEGRFKRLLARLYNRVAATRPGQWTARRFGPLFHVVCRRAEEPDPAGTRASSRPTLPRSMPSATPP